MTFPFSLRSFRARLIIGAVLWIAVGVVIASFVLTGLVRDTVISQFDHDAYDHSTELSMQIAFDGACPGMTADRRISDTRFIPTNSGAYWEIRCQNGETVRSPSLGSRDLPFSLGGGTADASKLSLGTGPTGPMRFLERRINSDLIGVSLDQSLIDTDLVQYQRATIVALATIGLGLLAAALAQIAFGLRPLARVRKVLQAIRRGEAHELPADLPEEVAPLAADLNALIKANDEIMRRARARAGNLAHALKNPLAILVDEGNRLRQAGNVAAADLIDEQCSRMQRQIDYEMARGRAAAQGSPHASAEIGPVVRTIVSAVARIYQSRGLSFSVTGEETIHVAVDPQDLSEIAGNLVDNAAKWARSRVEVTIARGAWTATIAVEDDGPGIPPEAREQVFGFGARLDESLPGAGLGLAITRDLVTAQRGTVTIGDSALGGARVTVELPLPGLQHHTR